MHVLLNLLHKFHLNVWTKHQQFPSASLKYSLKWVLSRLGMSSHSGLANVNKQSTKDVTVETVIDKNYLAPNQNAM